MSDLDPTRDARYKLTPPSSTRTNTPDTPASSAIPTSPDVSHTSHAANEGMLDEATRETERKAGPAERIAFMAGRDDFRNARMRCAIACQEYNNMAEDGTAEDRMAKWLK